MSRARHGVQKRRAKDVKRPSTRELGEHGVLAWLWKRPLATSAFLVCALAIAATVRIRELAADPRVSFLSNEADAEWIRADVPFWLKAYSAAETVTAFRYSFSTNAQVENARLTVRAFRQAAVTIDGTVIDRGARNLDDWKEARTVSLPSPIRAGRHVLRIVVSNRDAHSCLLAYCKELGIRTSPEWEAAPLPQPFQPAIAAAAVRPPELVRQYETAWDGFAALTPWLAGIFATGLVWTLWNSRTADRWGTGWRWRVTPGLIRWLLVAAWVVLAANNVWRLPPHLGFDVDRHYDYVKYIAQHRSLPLAREGWQMFQPPLFYLLAAPWYALLIPHMSDEVVIKALRVLPLFCGLAQIEFVYRAARVVFPGKDDLQIVATTVGGLLPMQIYISLVIGNEPLAGCLTAFVILLCFRLLAEPARQWRTRDYILLGLIWGLAILSKVTPLLLAPLVAAAVIWRSRLETQQERWRAGLSRIGSVFGACFMTSGWFFLRNWLELGKPLILGAGDAANDHDWWQDPSYRTWQQLASFGTALVRPVYSGAWSLWDSLYSTLWLDGLVSGSIAAPGRVPWNLRWMEAGAWLALVPMGLLIAGALSPWQKELRGSRAALLLAAAALAVYLAAMVDVYLRLPIYSTAKATYTLGLVPCYGVLVAAGAAPLMRFRLPRALIFSALTCWAVAAYAAYFVV
jgi:hypothetical protein